MLKVRDIMTTSVGGVSPESTLREVGALLADRHIGGAPVVAGHHVVGVISASDLLTFEASIPPVPTARPEEVEEELAAPEELEKGGEAPGAFFSDLWSDAGADVAERFREVTNPEWDLLEEHTVAEAMTCEVCSVRPDDEVASVAAYMLRADIHRLLVMTDGELFGIVTATDIVRAVASRRLRA